MALEGDQLSPEEDGRGDAGALPSVSVVIPTHGRAHRLASVVRAVLADPATSECVVCVDGSRDNSLRILERLAKEDHRLVPLAIEHQGKHGALRAALSRATGEVALLLDDDLVASEGLVSGHARHHRDRANLVVMGYTPCAPPEKPSPTSVLTELYSAEYERSCAEIEEALGHQAPGGPDDPVLHRLWGGNVSVRRSGLLSLGLRNPHFSHEDTDLGLRALRAGYVGVFDRSLAAQHLHGRSGMGFLSYSRQSGKGRWLLHHDHGDLLGPYGHESHGRRAVRRAALWVPMSLARLPTVGHGVAVGLIGAARVLCWARWSQGELVLYRTARVIEFEIGVREMARTPEAQIVDRSTAQLTGPT